MQCCPSCQVEVHEVEFCPHCGVKVGPRAGGAGEGDQDRELRTRVVYLAPDELTAITLQKVLESEGVDSWVQSIQVPGYDGLMGLVEGYWGRILVLEDQEDHARGTIEDYLRNVGPTVH